MRSTPMHEHGAGDRNPAVAGDNIRGDSCPLEDKHFTIDQLKDGNKPIDDDGRHRNKRKVECAVAIHPIQE